MPRSLMHSTRPGACKASAFASDLCMHCKPCHPQEALRRAALRCAQLPFGSLVTRTHKAVAHPAAWQGLWHPVSADSWLQRSSVVTAACSILTSRAHSNTNPNSWKRHSLAVTLWLYLRGECRNIDRPQHENTAGLSGAPRVHCPCCVKAVSTSGAAEGFLTFDHSARNGADVVAADHCGRCFACPASMWAPRIPHLADRPCDFALRPLCNALRSAALRLPMCSQTILQIRPSLSSSTCLSVSLNIACTAQ